MLHLWEQYIRTCRKRSGKSSRSRSAMEPECGRSERCLGVARPPSAGRSSTTRGCRPTRASRTGHTGRTPEDVTVDRALLRRRARAAQGRPAQGGAAQTVPPVPWAPVDAGGRVAGLRPLAAADRRQAARPVVGRQVHACMPGDHLPVDIRRQAAARAMGPLPASRPPAPAQTHGTQGVALPDSLPRVHP